MTEDDRSGPTPEEIDRELDRRIREIPAADEKASPPEPDQRAVCRCSAAPDGLRDQYAAAIRPTMLLGLQDAELDGVGGAQRINEWADWIAKTVAAVRDRELEQLRVEHAALKRAHVALAEQAGKNQAAIARVRRLCDVTIEHSVRVDAVHQAHDTLAALDELEETRS
jgi:hypothetical protein